MSSKESAHFVSPLGQDAKQAAARRRASDTKYAELEKKHEVALAIADLVILHRTRTGLTQQDLASQMRTSVSAISRLESGFHPGIGLLRGAQRLCRANNSRLRASLEFVS